MLVYFGPRAPEGIPVCRQTALLVGSKRATNRAPKHYLCAIEAHFALFPGTKSIPYHHYRRTHHTAAVYKPVSKLNIGLLRCTSYTRYRPNLHIFGMAGYRITPVLVFWTCRDLHWVKFTFETGFELPSSCPVLPCYAPNLNRNILDFMRWPQIDLGPQDLNDIQRPKSFQNNSWK